MTTDTTDASTVLGERPPDMAAEHWERVLASQQFGVNHPMHQLGRSYLYQYRVAQNAQRRIDELERRLDIVAEALREEAESRDWCDEYNTFVDKVNRLCGGAEVLRKCARGWEVTFRVTLTVSAKTPEEARSMASEAMNELGGFDVVDDISFCHEGTEQS